MSLQSYSVRCVKCSPSRSSVWLSQMDVSRHLSVIYNRPNNRLIWGKKKELTRRNCKKPQSKHILNPSLFSMVLFDLEANDFLTTVLFLCNTVTVFTIVIELGCRHGTTEWKMRSCESNSLRQKKAPLFHLSTFFWAFYQDHSISFNLHY